MDEKKPLDDQQIEAMLAPLRTHTGAKRSRLRPLVIGLRTYDRHVAYPRP